MANSFERIYAVVKKIPRGTVASYGQVALLAGNPRWARVVGYALHANPDPEGMLPQEPLHVVHRSGAKSFRQAVGRSR